ncbi:MAG TPA: DUF3368 domain-containing protein [Pyrinomonadaceae bacterium]|nr:DUF3368 domain-containing protein [Pyrinomonadaceae bacterium]
MKKRRASCGNLSKIAPNGSKFDRRRFCSIPIWTNSTRAKREAIILAEDLKADVLLIDEQFGRKVALKRNLRVVGTLGILERAAEKGLLDFAETLQGLKENGFFIAPVLEKDFLRRDKKRKQLKNNK